MGEETERWAAWIAQLTGVGGLDFMTLRPFRQVLSSLHLIPKSDRWCPCCLATDRDSDQEPYLRLVWDIAPVTVCLTHKVELVHQCPHCHRGNVRNRAAVVIPGYCTACGGFLGDAMTSPATPEAMWIARQVGAAVANPPMPGFNGRLADLLREVVGRMSGGNVARFARRLDLKKSGVGHWLNHDGHPTLQAWLGISLEGGIALERLMAGELEGWDPPVTQQLQLSLGLPPSARKGVKSRVLDWDEIQLQLQAILKEDIPITLAAASIRVEVDVKNLYLRANREARAISARFQDYEQRKKQAREQALKDTVATVLAQRQADGYAGLSAREMRELLKGTELANVRNAFAVIKQVREGPA